MTQLETNRAREQAQAQLENIREMVKALRDAFDHDTENEDNNDNGNEEKILVSIEEAEEAIREDPLEVSIRTGWHGIGNNPEPDEYRILLYTGGSEVVLIGRLYHNLPIDVFLEYQGCVKPWERYPLDRDEKDDCLTYARQFDFG